LPATTWPQAKGYYKAEGLDVTIKPGGPDIGPVQVIAGNGADVIVNWMPSMPGLARSRCAPGQHRPGVQPVRPDADLQEGQRRGQPEDLKGKTLGVWYGGNEYPFLNWMAKLG
jgi:NitT/TauT family transport system substrate-binding protein